MRGAAADGLALLGDERAVEPLGKLLDSTDHRDRSRAVGALLRIGGQRAIALLSGTLRSSDQTTASR
jgi:HEAT repeat protein